MIQERREPFLCGECRHEQPYHRHAVVCIDCVYALKKRVSHLEDGLDMSMKQVRSYRGKVGRWKQVAEAYKTKAETLRWQLEQAQEQQRAFANENRALRKRKEQLVKENDKENTLRQELEFRLSDHHQMLMEDRETISNLKDDRTALIHLLEREYGDIGTVFEALEEQKEREMEQ